jgi:hypothetical protein
LDGKSATTTHAAAPPQPTPSSPLQSPAFGFYQAPIQFTTFPSFHVSKDLLATTPVLSAANSTSNSSTSSYSNSNSNSTSSQHDAAIQSIVGGFRSDQPLEVLRCLVNHVSLLMDTSMFGLVSDAVRRASQSDVEHRQKLLPIEAVCSISRLLGVLGNVPLLTTREQFMGVARELYQGFKNPLDGLSVWLSQAAIFLDNNQSRASYFLRLGPFWIEWRHKYQEAPGIHAQFSVMAKDICGHNLSVEYLGVLAALMSMHAETTATKKTKDKSLFSHMGKLVFDSLTARSDDEVGAAQTLWNMTVYRTNTSLTQLKALLATGAYNSRLGARIRQSNRVERKKASKKKSSKDNEDEDQEMRDAEISDREAEVEMGGKMGKPLEPNRSTSDANDVQDGDDQKEKSKSKGRKRKKTAKMAAVINTSKKKKHLIPFFFLSVATGQRIRGWS